jgi:nucleoside-diphosphate-sugar epimerase
LTKTIFITGVSGTIGTILRNALSTTFEVDGIDLNYSTDINLHDMTDLDSCYKFFQNIDVVIDLAARADQYASWSEIYNNNFMATRNAFEAAKMAGVEKFIFASSNHAVGNFESEDPYKSIVVGDYENISPQSFDFISSTCPIRPDGHYGISKALGESIGRYYSDIHGLAVFCLRIGTVRADDTPQNVRQLATFLFQKDLIDLILKCIEAPSDLKFGIYYGVSNNKWRFWDIENAYMDLGYKPQCNAEDFRNTLSR